MAQPTATDMAVRSRAAARLSLGLLLAVPALLGGRAGASAQMAPPELPIGRDDLVRVVDHAGERELEVVLGPVALPAGGPHLRPQLQLVTLPTEGWLHGFRWEMRDESGRRLPDELLHHWNFVDPDARELFAPVPRRILAAGRETSAQGMPSLLGMPVGPDTRILIISMFANPTEVPYEQAFLHVWMDYTPASDPGLIRPRDVFTFYFDVMGPVGDKDFPLPPGEHERSWEASPAVDARILGLSGHLHDHAAWIRLEDVTTGHVIWEAEPEIGEDGRVMGVPTGKLWWRGGRRIFKDHVYRLSVRYRNPLDALAPDGGMGALGGIILADRDDWPAVDKAEMAYMQDLRNMLEKPNEAHGGHGGMDHSGMDHSATESHEHASGDGSARTEGTGRAPTRKP